MSELQGSSLGYVPIPCDSSLPQKPADCTQLSALRGRAFSRSQGVFLINPMLSATNENKEITASLTFAQA